MAVKKRPDGRSTGQIRNFEILLHNGARAVRAGGDSDESVPREPFKTKSHGRDTGEIL